MIKDNFYRDSIILTVSNLTAGILRFMFSILLSKKLGAEGMGLYSLVMPIYDLFTCLICGGMVTAISKESSSYYGLGDYGNLDKSIHTALIFDFVWSVLITISVFIFAPFISTYIIKDPRTVYSLWVIQRHGICQRIPGRSTYREGWRRHRIWRGRFSRLVAGFTGYV